MIGWEYVEQIVSPPSPKMQFGLDVHKSLEDWLRDATPPDKDTAPGQVAAQGLHWLPAPSRKFMEVEAQFDTRVESALNRMNVPTKADLKAVERKLDLLNQKLDKLVKS